MNFDEYVGILREKWHNLPAGNEVLDSNAFLELEDSIFEATWNAKNAAAWDWSHRAWAHFLYNPIIKGAFILEIGSGYGFDAIPFALAGANVTCVDISLDNLECIQRIAKAKGVHITTCYLETLKSLDALSQYDIVWAWGSLHTAPREVIKEECESIVPHLEKSGRWLQLAYPERRWNREGKKKFGEWGNKTDSGAPWMEWYDLEKLLKILPPKTFSPVMSFDFHNHDFNWFDLVKIQ